MNMCVGATILKIQEKYCICTIVGCYAFVEIENDDDYLPRGKMRMNILSIPS